MDHNMKVIFLDIDGVLNSERSVAAYGDESTLDPVACCLLKHLLKKTGAYIVVVSNWRKGLTLDELRAKLLKAAGKKIARRTIGKVADANVSRGDLVDAWMHAEGFTSRYAILDDKADYSAAQMRCLVKVDPAVGLCVADCEAALILLGVAE